MAELILSLIYLVIFDLSLVNTACFKKSICAAEKKVLDKMVGSAYTDIQVVRKAVHQCGSQAKISHLK